MWRRSRELQPFITDLGRLTFLPPAARRVLDADAIAGWGLKGQGRDLAARRALPYLSLEDGFLRSAGLIRPYDPLLSLIADDRGIYYDARQPSRLEELIAGLGPLSSDRAEMAEALRTLIVEENLGKFNGAPDLEETSPLGRDRPLVIVVDQIAGDMSIPGALCSADSFVQMLEAAVRENADCEIIVRLHPQDGKGGRVGHLRAAAERRGLPVIEGNLTWMSLAKRASRVYVASSQAGFEALMADVPVTCFGMPFYAGWGLTEDRQSLARRRARPTLDQLVYAAYERYSRYLNPVTGERCGALDIARFLSAARRRRLDFPDRTVVLGVQRFKARNLRPFVDGGEAPPVFTMDPARASDAARRGRVPLVAWVSRVDARVLGEVRGAGLDLRHVEDGFLRSIGLGSDLVPPASLVFDRQGIYYDMSGPSDLESLIEAGGFPPVLLARAARLRERLIEARLTKYNVGAAAALAWPADGRRRLLVPGQVENDASIRLGSPEVKTNLDLLRAVRAAAPEAFIAYKPHPDVESGNRPGAITPAALDGLADAVFGGVDALTALSGADEVHTMTSLLGFEALLREKRVVTYGGPFYAGWGLTEDRLAFARRRRRANLDELVAAALILYPRYADPRTGLPATAEDIVTLLTRRRAATPLLVTLALQPLLRLGRRLGFVRA